MAKVSDVKAAEIAREKVEKQNANLVKLAKYVGLKLKPTTQSEEVSQIFEFELESSIMPNKLSRLGERKLQECGDQWLHGYTLTPVSLTIDFSKLPEDAYDTIMATLAEIATGRAHFRAEEANNGLAGGVVDANNVYDAAVVGAARVRDETLSNLFSQASGSVRNAYQDLKVILQDVQLPIHAVQQSEEKALAELNKNKQAGGRAR